MRVITAKARVSSAAIVVVVLLILFVTRVPAIILTPDRELWLLAGDSGDAFLHQARIELLMMRGADPTYTYGGPKGYSTLEMAAAARNIEFVRRFADRATPQQRQRILALARSSEDPIVREELERVFQENGKPMPGESR